MYQDLTKGSITRGLLLFALPMVAGNLLQQLYNIADTLIVGQALGRNALAAVGSAFTLMTFLTSIFLGLSMGRRGAVLHLSRQEGSPGFAQRGGPCLCPDCGCNPGAEPRSLSADGPHPALSANSTGAVCLHAGISLDHLRRPAATFLYNFSASLLRSAGNSVAPLWFLGASALLNIGLDLLFVLVFHWGVAGAAVATVIAQYLSGVGLGLYVLLRCRELLPRRSELRFSGRILRELLDLSLLTCAPAVRHELRHPAGTASGRQLWSRSPWPLLRRL